MPDCVGLLEKARRRPQGLSFGEASQLAECFGFRLARQRGSHRVYKLAGFMSLLTFQPAHNDGAKAYQVRQLLNAIAELRSDEDGP